MDIHANVDERYEEPSCEGFQFAATADGINTRENYINIAKLASERVVDSDDVFRVRLGRPESVRLNPELVLDRASERYRQQLLRKSISVLAEEERLISELPQIPIREQLESLLRDAEMHAKARAEIDAQIKIVSTADSALEQASRKLQSAEGQLKEVLDKSGLKPSQMEAYTEVVEQILQRGWQPEHLAARSSEIQTLLKDRHLVNKLEKAIDIKGNLTAKKSILEKRVESLDKRIKDSQELERTLAQARASNLQIEMRRRNSRFWATLKSYVVDTIVATAWMEQKISELHRGEAEQEKPGATTELDQTRRAIQSSERTILQILSSLNRTPSLESAYGTLLALKADLEKGDLLERTSAFGFSNAFLAWKELKEASALVAALVEVVARNKKISNEEHNILERVQLEYSDQQVALCQAAVTDAAIKLEVEIPNLQSSSTESVIEFSDRLAKRLNPFSYAERGGIVFENRFSNITRGSRAKVWTSKKS